MIRTLLVDDQHLVRAGLRMLCDTTSDIEVVGEAADGAEATREVDRLTPDVVLMDLHMPGVDGVTATKQILTTHPPTRILVLTTFDDDEHLYAALSAGAQGFLGKDAPPDQLLDAIRRTAAGESPFSADVLTRIVHTAVTAHQNHVPLEGLTARERDVLTLLSEGLSNAEIAEQLHVAVSTVKTHVTALMNKTGATNRVKLAVLTRSR